MISMVSLESMARLGGLWNLTLTNKQSPFFLLFFFSFFSFLVHTKII